MRFAGLPYVLTVARIDSAGPEKPGASFMAPWLAGRSHLACLSPPRSAVRDIGRCQGVAEPQRVGSSI
jgi:hypothetical protein